MNSFASVLCKCYLFCSAILGGLAVLAIVAAIYDAYFRPHILRKSITQDDVQLRGHFQLALILTKILKHECESKLIDEPFPVN